MKSVILNKPRCIRGREYQIGDVVSLADEDADDLMAMGIASKPPEPKPAAARSAAAPAATTVAPAMVRVRLHRPLINNGVRHAGGSIIEVPAREAFAMTYAGDVLDAPPADQLPALQERANLAARLGRYHGFPLGLARSS